MHDLTVLHGTIYRKLRHRVHEKNGINSNTGNYLFQNVAGGVVEIGMCCGELGPRTMTSLCPLLYQMQLARIRKFMLENNNYFEELALLIRQLQHLLDF